MHIKRLLRLRNKNIKDINRDLYQKYFDAHFYINRNMPDMSIVAPAQEALDHYLTSGWKLKLNPSSFFDIEWYLSNIPISEQEEEPILHYVTKGWRVGISPSPYFDISWYLTQNPDVRAAGVEPLSHFIAYGQYEGRRAHPDFSNAYILGNMNKSDNHDIIVTGEPCLDWWLSEYPLVSIIIANHNGMEHLSDLFDSLDDQTYRNFEVIFVDDASTDGSIKIAEKRGAKVVPLNGQSGFASANNFGLSESAGELIALLNNDMRVDSNWVEQMVRTMRQNPDVGAVAPLIRFWSKFVRIEIFAAKTFSISLSSFIQSLEYKKWFLRLGYVDGDSVYAHEAGNNCKIVLDVPVQSGSLTFHVTSASNFLVSIGCGCVIYRARVSSTESSICYRLPAHARKGGFFVVNNAGSVNNDEGLPSDRGFGEVDEGQYSDGKEVAFLCGGAALIRRDALKGRPLFFGDFVAYFEDSELSVRLRKEGYRIIYEPRAIVYHRHSASTQEYSAFWLHHVFRNRIVYTYACADNEKRTSILKSLPLVIEEARNHIVSKKLPTEAEVEFLGRLVTVGDEIRALCGHFDESDAPLATELRIGVYDPFWATLGGGEARALSVASALSRFARVELISDSDFDPEVLCATFGVEPFAWRKRVVRRMTSNISAEYDIFVNAAFQSELVSQARFSFFLISFPSKTPSSQFLSSYRFLANSMYTKVWAERMWGNTGEFECDVVYPSIDPRFKIDLSAEAPKKCSILSVGRFASEGHVKNQKEIINAFIAARSLRPDLFDGWELVLIGSSNEETYVADVISMASGYPIRVIVDAAFETVVSAYRDASIYVHASGLGRDPHQQPELMEHFGIAVAQALASGSYPIVYDAAGPREIVENAGVGSLFRDGDELRDVLVDIVAKANGGELDRILHKLVEASEKYGEKSHSELIIGMVCAHLGVK